jgi:hypothetical protein
LQGERVTHSGLINFINRQYGVDEAGCWFVQNGPQRVFVSLAYTPWVFRREGENFISHTGEAAGRVKTVYLDEEGSLLLDTELGIGLLDDRDLAGFIAECQPGDEQNFLDLMQGQPVTISWKNLSLQPSATVHVAKRHNFNPAPKAETA